MRANEFITEIFQSGKKNWKWIRKDNTYASARFSVGNRTYTWQAHGAESDNDGPTRWILEFRIERELADPDKLDVWGKTGTGNSAEVMSTAVDITREFIKEYGNEISELTFDAKEDSRIGLYAKMIARLLPGWELNQTYNNIEIIIVDDSSTDDSRDIILEYQAKYGNTDLRGGAREQDIMSSGSGSDSDPAQDDLDGIEMQKLIPPILQLDIDEEIKQ